MFQNLPYKTKTAAVLAHLRTGRSITAAEAQAEYGLFRLAVIIETIRKRGFYVRTDMRTAANGTRYARYSM